MWQKPTVMLVVVTSDISFNFHVAIMKWCNYYTWGQTDIRSCHQIQPGSDYLAKLCSDQLANFMHDWVNFQFWYASVSEQWLLRQYQSANCLETMAFSVPADHGTTICNCKHA